MIKFLHISDVHLNAGFSNKSDAVRLKLKEGLFKAVSNAIDYTIRESLEGILITGDLFDHDKITFRDASFVLDNFNRLLSNQQKIFYVTGNHDPMNTAVFLEPLKAHRYFHLFDDDEIKVVEVVAQNGQPYKIVGVGHKSRNEQRNLIQNFPVKREAGIWIGIGHASVPAALTTPEKENYMAVALSQIEALEYDYFGLGHIHIRQKLAEKIAYAGNIQGLNVKETGAKGGVLVKIDNGTTQLEEVNFNEIGWFQSELLITEEMNDLHSVQAALIEKVTELIAQNNFAANQLLIRIHLIGKTQLKRQLEDAPNHVYLNEIVKEKTGILSLEIKTDQLRNMVDTDALISEKTVLSQIIQSIEGIREDSILCNRILELPIFDSLMSTDAKLAYIEKKKSLMIEEIVERMVVTRDER